MVKFECKMCGECCKNIRGFSIFTEEEKKGMINAFSLSEKTIFYIVPKVEDMTFILYEWEIEKLRKLANSKGIVLSIKPLRGVMSSDGIPIIHEWMFDHSSCPFLKEDRCSIHEDRPITCQSFPLYTSITSYLEGDSENNMIGPLNCPNFTELPKEQLENKKFNLKEYSKILYEVYGDVFLGSAKSDIASIINRKLIELILRRGYLSRNKISRDSFIKKYEKSSYSLFQFLISRGIRTKEEIASIPNNIEKASNDLINNDHIDLVY